MEPARPKFCGPYQEARQVSGRPMCQYTRRTCPYGVHACQACGKPGHGAADCRSPEPSEVTPPVPEEAPPLPKSASFPKSAALVQPIPSAVPAAQPPVFVPGFGFKGEGKAANYGVAIPRPTLLPPPQVPPPAPQPGSPSGIEGVEAPPPSEPLIPAPIQAKTEEVEEWVSSNFKPLTNLSTKTPPEIGENILWRGVKTGKAGCPSTKCEYFNGKVRSLQVDEHGELFLYLD